MKHTCFTFPYTEQHAYEKKNPASQVSNMRKYPRGDTLKTGLINQLSLMIQRMMVLKIHNIKDNYRQNTPW